VFEPGRRDAGGLRAADVEVSDDLAGGVGAGFAGRLAGDFEPGHEAAGTAGWRGQGERASGLAAAAAVKALSGKGIGEFGVARFAEDLDDSGGHFRKRGGHGRRLGAGERIEPGHVYHVPAVSSRWRGSSGLRALKRAMGLVVVVRAASVMSWSLS
jgi:hypothetical protein